MWLGAILLVGCEQPRTELVVRVESEIEWGADRTVQAVVLTVRRSGPDGPVRGMRTTALGTEGSRQPLPLLVGVIPASDDVDTPLWIEVLGCGEPNGDGCTAATARVTQRAVVTFVRGQTQELPLLLAQRCLGRTCALDERCSTSGQCEAATVAQGMVRPFQGTGAPTALDAGVAMVDAGTPTDQSGTDLPVLRDAGSGVDTGACGAAGRTCCVGGMCGAGLACAAGLCTAACGLGEGVVCTPDAGTSGCCADGRSCASAGSGYRCCRPAGGRCTPSVSQSAGCCGNLVCHSSGECVSPGCGITTGPCVGGRCCSGVCRSNICYPG